MTKNHNYYLNLAYQLAEQNLGKTGLNPSVGAIVVKNDSVISSGITSFRGRPHAEFNALSKLKNFAGASLYTSLEPCVHFGKTPPCTKIISKIVRNLEGLGESEIPTPTIGKFIMDGLSSLDKVAYVRFASVYKNFKEAKDFEQFIGNLDDKKS